MSRWVVSLYLIILAGILPGWAAYTISQRVLLPNGQPAAGAAVTVRLARPESRRFEELRAVTDARGAYAVSGQVDPAGVANLTAGYALIDAPGCVLTVTELPLLRAGAAPATLRLDEDCPYAGRVVDEAGTPMAGATLSVIQLGGTDSWGSIRALLNAPLMNLATPIMTAKTDAAGAFILRGATLVDDDHAGTAGDGALTPGKLVAFVQTAAGLLAGETDIIFKPANVPQGNPPRPLVVAPTLTVRGTVINAQSNNAVGNAEITFAGESAAASVLPAARTDARGTFEYYGVPRMSNIYAIADHQNTSTGWAVVTQRLRNAADRAQLLRQVTIKLRPLANTNITIVDGAGQPLAVPGSLMAIADEGARVGSVLVGRDTATGALAEGRVTMRMAVGRNRLELQAPGYTLLEESAELYVPGDGVKALALKAARDKGFLVRFTTNHPDGFFGTKLQVRTANGAVLTAGGAMGIRADGWWFAPAGDLGDTVELHVLRGGMEVLPWVTLSADPAKAVVMLAVK